MRLQIMIADEIVARVDKLAKESGLSRSAFCNMLVADGVRSRESANAFLASLPDSVRQAMSNPDVVKAIQNEKGGST